MASSPSSSSSPSHYPSSSPSAHRLATTAAMSPEIRPGPSPDLLAAWGEYRGGASPSPSIGSMNGSTPRQSKRDLIRSRHPPPHHISKLENVIGRASPSNDGGTVGGRISGKGKGKSSSNGGDDQQGEVHAAITTDVGILKDEVYDEYLHPVIAYIRRWLVWSLRKETAFLAWHQPRVRTPFLDRYFVYTSLFGTHSFFLIFLPSAFWIGSRYFGRGLVATLAFGVYLSSAIKDLFCVPRPYSPPVTRLTVGTTHLEFGFPSTHSTNSVGTALYIYLWIFSLRQRPDVLTSLSPAALDSRLWEVGLSFYVFSVVYGRIYAGMHSMMDCFAGSALGASITLIQWYGADAIERFLEIEGWTVPMVLIPACLFMVYVHPEPLDDCPCFEDAIAFIAVVMGTSLGRWASLRWNTFGKLVEDPFVPGRYSVEELLIQHRPTTALDKLIAAGSYLLVIVLGVACIFCVRIVVKTSCKLLLPPMFRFLDRSFGLVLPRRHYVPSSEYTDVPMNNIIRSPSFMDLPDSFTPTITPAANPGQEGNKATTSIQARLAAIQGLVRSQSPLSVFSDDDFSPPSSRPGSPDSSFSLLLGRGNPSTASSSSTTTSATALKSRISQQSHPRLLPVPPSRSGASSPLQQHIGPYHPSVPITHAVMTPGGAEVPLEKVAERIAGKGSEKEEKNGQVKAVEQSLVTHYDIDVLTKVLVYSNIGFFAACIIPASLEWVGLTPP